jgi:hypothetical protein
MSERIAADLEVGDHTSFWLARDGNEATFFGRVLVKKEKQKGNPSLIVEVTDVRSFPQRPRITMAIGGGTKVGSRG